VPGLENRGVGGHVRLRARVRLDVRVHGAEERLRAVDRGLLDLVDDLAAAVVALARIALRVLVRRRGADGLEDRAPVEVLRGGQLDLAPLPLGLALEERGDLRVDVGEARGAKVVDRFLHYGHGASSSPGFRRRILSGSNGPARSPARQTC